jgi:hypothetical protein
MSVKRIQILSEAKNDLHEGRDFYDRQDKKVGDYFFDSLLSDVESLIIYAGIHRKEFGFYRMLSKRFPYAIYYDLAKGVVSVIAILPMRRDPLWIASKLRRRN